MNYGQLKQNVTTLLNHDECTDELSAIFVQKALARLQRTLRLPGMESQYSIIATSNTTGIELPNDFLEEKEVYVRGGRGTLVKKTLGYILGRGDFIGIPCVYAREGGIFRLWPRPAPATTVVINYYGEFEPLEADSDFNMASVLCPDVVVDCALTYAADHFIDERRASWEASWTSAAAELMSQAEAEASSGALVMSSAYDLNDGTY